MAGRGRSNPPGARFAENRVWQPGFGPVARPTGGKQRPADRSDASVSAVGCFGTSAPWKASDHCVARSRPLMGRSPRKHRAMARRQRRAIATDLTVEESPEVEQPASTLPGRAPACGSRVRRAERPRATARGHGSRWPGTEMSMRTARNGEAGFPAEPVQAARDLDGPVDAAWAAGKGKASKGGAPVGMPRSRTRELVVTKVDRAFLLGGGMEDPTAAPDRAAPRGSEDRHGGERPASAGRQPPGTANEGRRKG